MGQVQRLSLSEGLQQAFRKTHRMTAFGASRNDPFLVGYVLGAFGAMHQDLR
jgi:hypothetical protein